MLTIDCLPEHKVYYHGSSSNCNINNKLLPPDISDNISESGRLKNLDKVFFTEDKKSALIYAGRACHVFGGKVVLYRVIPMAKIDCLNNSKGTSVFMTSWALVEKIN